MKNSSKKRNPSSKYKVRKCRICKSTKLYNFLSLGSMPIPNGFLTKEELSHDEPYYPLGAFVCESCWLVQLTHVIPPEIMFKNYLYIPSTSTTMLQHFRSFATDVVNKYKLEKDDLVIDIGSNDGTLLGFFKDEEISVLGVDPATNLAQVARLKGIDTIDDFFSPKLASQIVKQKGKAKIITATNVIAHIDDLHSVCEGVNVLLDDEGIFITEYPYLMDLLDNNEFDTIYHEHLSYFSIRPLIELFKKHNMRIIDIYRSSMIHGGSIRVFAAKNTSLHKQKPIVDEYVANETLKKMDRRSTYDDFARRVRSIKRDLIAYLKRLKKQNKKIIGYGASAKCNVLLNYCGISTNLLDYIVDSISYKQGRYTPGTHVPIYPENRLMKDMPDYALLTAWNFKEEILRKQLEYREKGGQFIITIPYLRIE